MKEVSYINPNLFAPKDAWDKLSLTEKAEMMKVAVRNGITDLKTIREKYNEFAKGGYLDWKEKANKYKHLDIDNDRTYDYEGWYNENPQRAWNFLNDSPDAHFDDKYKTVYHPTFSTQSKYSGKKDAAYNPIGLVGGTWDKQGTVFTMSPDGYRGPVSMDERKWYLENAEDNGVQLREADGSLPVFDDIPWGGVLPNITITGNRFANGGGIHIKDSKKGTFTAAAKKHGKSVQAFASQVLTHPENYSPAMRKKANFARNAAKWHGLGGNLYDGTSEDTQQVNVVGYPLVDAASEGLTEYFSNNPNVAGMAIGAGLNGIDGNRRVVLNPNLTDRNTRNSVYMNESYRHYFDVNNTVLPALTNIQKNAYIGTPYEGLDKQIQRTEAARYLSGDPSHHLNDAQKAYLDKFDFIYPGGRLPEITVTGKKKKALGGNLFDGITEDSQQMQIGRPFWQSQAQEPSFMESLAEFNKQQELKKQQQRQALRKKINTIGRKLAEERMRESSVESNDNAWVDTPLTYKKKNPHSSRKAEDGAKAHAAWEKEHPILTAWGNVAGALPLAIAAVPLGAGIVAGGDALAATTAGQAVTSGLAPLYQATTGVSVAGAPALAWTDAGLTSAFGAHGLQQAVEDGSISPMTALEVASLGRLAKPIAKEAALAIENYRYPLGRPQIPEGFGSTSTFTFGDLGDKAGYYTHVGIPKSKVWISKDRIWPELSELGENSKGVPLYQIDSKAYDARFGEPSLVDYEGNSLGVPISKGSWEEPNSIFRGFPQAIISKEQMMKVPYTKTYRNPVTGLWERELYQPERTVFPEETPAVEWPMGRTTPQITAENAASITSEQWTAAQDAAIARGDMAEAQRLRDLHFKTKASKNKLIDENGNPVAVKHHGNVWNVFDPDRTMSGTLWTANEDAFKLSDIKTFPASDLPTEWKNLYINMKNPIQDEVSIGTTRMLSEIRKGSEGAIKESIRDYGISNPDGVFKRIKITEDFLKKNGYDLNDQEIQEILNNPEFYGKEPTMAATAYPNNIKLSDAVTYDDKGVRVPLGERDNFNINDIRYGLLPFGIGLTGYGLFNNQEAFGGRKK